MALEDWQRWLSVSNNITAAVLRLESFAEEITNHSQIISSYCCRVWHFIHFYILFLQYNSELCVAVRNEVFVITDSVSWSSFRFRPTVFIVSLYRHAESNCYLSVSQLTQCEYDGMFRKQINCA